jgi:hypothetical protein
MRMINCKRDCERGRRILKCEIEKEGLRERERKRKRYIEVCGRYRKIERGREIKRKRRREIEKEREKKER